MRTSPTAVMMSWLLLLAASSGADAQEWTHFRAPNGAAGCIFLHTEEQAQDAETPTGRLKKLGARLQLDAEKRIVGVNLGERRITDADLALLKGLEHLRELDLTRTPITSAGLEHSKELKTLKTLYLTDTKVDDSGIGQLKELKNLELLGLSGTKVGDASLDMLKELTALKQLYCIGTKITDAGAAKLEKALPKCLVAH